MVFRNLYKRYINIPLFSINILHFRDYFGTLFAAPKRILNGSDKYYVDRLASVSYHRKSA